MQTFDNLPKTTQQTSDILYPNNPWVFVLKFYSNRSATFIIGEMITKDNLNITNLVQTLKTFFSKNYSSECCTLIVLGYVYLKIYSNGGWFCITS